MDPLHSNQTPFSSSPNNDGKGKNPKLNFLKKIWNGMLGKLGVGKIKRLVTVKTGQEKGTKRVDQLFKQTLQSDKHSEEAKSAIKHLQQLADANPEEDWVKDAPTIIKTIIVATEVSKLEKKGDATLEHTLRVGKTKLTLHVIDSKEGLKITGLFGKLLGAGAHGETIRTVNLLEGKLSSGEKSVMKSPRGWDVVMSEESLNHEKRMLDYIHSKLDHTKKDLYPGQGHRVKDYKTNDEVLLSPFIPGSDLDTFLKKQKPDLELKKKIANKIIEAVNGLHEIGVYHLDLKLDNFMIEMKDGEPQVKLIDFGSAQAIDLLADVEKSPYMKGWIMDYRDEESDFRYDSPFGNYEHWMTQQGKTRDSEAIGHIQRNIENIETQELALTLTHLFTGIESNYDNSSWQKYTLRDLPIGEDQKKTIKKAALFGGIPKTGTSIPQDIYKLTF